MEFNQQEVDGLFQLKKYPCKTAKVRFPMQGESVEIELENEAGKIQFQADINRANKIVNKITFQLRHKKIYIIRRLDLNGNHTNPPAPVPDAIFNGYEDYIFKYEDHVHFYIDGYNERWALPLAKLEEIEILAEDDIYEKMSKFFKYCNIENLEFKITKDLLL